MGYTSYSVSNRSTRAESSGYFSKKVDEVFEQNKKKVIHESMNPVNAKLRECRDSETHPNSLPIILALDVTGSMLEVPFHLIKDGLPNIMGKFVQSGLQDASLLFLAIGDTVYDSYPLQVGQFESGDKELDTWLTRTYLEGGGGGNFGESYLLAWYFASKHIITDAFEKRKQKGFLFTIGDEPSLDSLPSNVIQEIIEENPQVSYDDKTLLKMAQEKYNVYHLHVLEGTAGTRSLSYWKKLLGQNCIEITNHQDIPKILTQIVLDNYQKTSDKQVLETKKQDEGNKNDEETEVIL